ncbi:MAG TPA: FixH family protein [Bacteroidia bacterium]|nr:FixH family protein [Bacteroidia bacterium]
MKRNIQLIILSALLIFFTQCRKNEAQPEPEPAPVNPSNPTDGMLKLGEVYMQNANAKAVLYTPKDLVTGYNTIYAAIYDSSNGSKLLNGHFEVLPSMNMGSGMSHGCPFENYEDSVPDNGLFSCAVVFSMEGNAQQWNLDFGFHNHQNEKFGNGKLGVNVLASSPSRLIKTVLSSDSNSTVMIALLQPGSAKVGINDLELVMYKKKDDFSYLPVTDYNIEIEPNMPSMGHGSPNNVNPVHSENGHYKGKVNFTMTGLWQIKLKLYRNGTLISSDQYFEITL